MSGKWIRDLQPTTLLVDAARRVLLTRLEVVRDYLPLAIFEPDKDVEHVHQLRVGTRRARAAIGIFSNCLPKKAKRQAKEVLRSLRRGAGEARDWDVHLLHLLQPDRTTTDRQQPAMDLLIGHALGQRDQAQKELDKLAPRHPFEFDRFLAETTAQVRPPDLSPNQTLQDHAGPSLKKRLDRLVPALEADLSDYEHLHEVRIMGKRLRYAMEVFVCCFDDSFRDVHYQKISEMQDLLGEANDSFVAGGRLRKLQTKLMDLDPAMWHRYRSGIEGLLRHHEHRLTQKEEEFRQWLSQWRSEGQLEDLLRMVEEKGDRQGA